MCYTTIVLVGTMEFINKIQRKRIKWCHCQNSSSLIILKNLLEKLKKIYWKKFFHSLWAYFGILNKAKYRILTNGFLWACKNHEMCEPLVHIQWAENGKIVSSQDQKNSWNQMFIQFHEKTWEICFFPNFSSLYGIFFYTLLTLSEVRCLVSLVVAIV